MRVPNFEAKRWGSIAEQCGLKAKGLTLCRQPPETNPFRGIPIPETNPFDMSYVTYPAEVGTVGRLIDFIDNEKHWPWPRDWFTTVSFIMKGLYDL